ncbi:hypothetical protein [Streptomyces niveus]|uniref:hypothetical protein n=1 Tax=Streptomyces niveus TaxID=193462 RepID=UPI00343EF3DD
MESADVSPGQVYRSCDPRSGRTVTVVRVRGDRADVVDAQDGMRPRSVLLKGFHTSLTTYGGHPRRSGYVLVPEMTGTGAASARPAEPNLVDARIVTSHVRHLLAQQPPPSIAGIARAAQIPVTTLRTILLDVEAGKPRTMQQGTAASLLAVGRTSDGPAAPQNRRGVMASTVVDHVRSLQKAYELASVAFIAKTAGVPASTLKAVLNQHSLDPLRTMDTAAASKVLAVTTLPAPAFPRYDHVTDIGLLRRLRGLCALGWPLRSIAQPGGIASKTLNEFLLNETSTPTTRAAVLIAWKELSHRPGPSAVARRLAAKKLWAPPLAWDDGTIDKPTAVPDGVRTARTCAGWTPDLLREELEFLRRAGLNWTESLRRLSLGSGRAHELLGTEETRCPPQSLPSTPEHDLAPAA